MASYGSRSPSPPSTPSSRRMKTCARRCERGLCTVATYFPLAFIYSLTTWAVWVDARIGFHKEKVDEHIPYSKTIPSTIGVILYILLNASYTVAVFKDPGSPTNTGPSKGRGRYSVLPTSEPHDVNDLQTITVSSSGHSRYCKKCHVSKPDRTHHCSTCKRCVLKMDHHCPWLATCLGLHNYKAFVLFLIYLSLFCWACFVNTAFWVYHEIFEANNHSLEKFAPVNVILLAVLSGIIGLVMTGFTGWHIYLTIRGQTTIECLERTRYLSGVRRVVEANRQENATHSRNNSESLTANLKRIGDQVLEFHANAVPGASRFEEGEEHTSPTPSEHVPTAQRGTMPASLNARLGDSPAQQALRTTYQDYETQRESDRYEEYLLEQDSSKLPNAFDLGWRKNLNHLFGPNPLLWWLPVCNTTGDGWRWEVSEKWAKANDEATQRREERLRNERMQAQASHQYAGQLRGGGGSGGGAGRYYNDHDGHSSYDFAHQHHLNGQNSYDETRSALSMHTLKSHRSGGKMKRDFDTSADGEIASFEVSGSEDEGEESSNPSDTNEGSKVRNGMRKKKIGGGSRGTANKDRDGWGRQW